MTKENSKPTSTENLVTSSSTAPVELSESELEQAAGGRKAGGTQQEYLKIKMNDVIITG
jgi:hypothetical protein